MKAFNKIIPSLLERYPRANLIKIAPIIHKLPALSLQLQHSIYILRDDLTGFALGGNKTRKLDYLVGDAINKGADTLITRNATSFSRNAAVAASACGLNIHVVLPGDEDGQNPASQALFNQCGARLHHVTGGSDALSEVYDQVLKSLIKMNKSVYELHPGGSDTIGALGYLHTYHDIVEYAYQHDIHFSDIIHSTSSAGTQAGLVLGQCTNTYDTRILGVSAALTAETQTGRVRELALSTAGMLGVQLDDSKILVDDSFVGPGYATPSEEGEYATKLLASLEGILLDPVYTGKAAAAMLSYAENGMFKDGSVLFIHTGGNAGLFY